MAHAAGRIIGERNSARVAPREQCQQVLRARVDGRVDAHMLFRVQSMQVALDANGSSITLFQLRRHAGMIVSSLSFARGTQGLSLRIRSSVADRGAIRGRPRVRALPF